MTPPFDVTAPVLFALDVHYADPRAHAACVAFHAWADQRAVHELTVTVDDVAPYEPGALFKRELPPLLAVIAEMRKHATPSLALVDGYVTLDAGRAGLGAMLHSATGLPVVGVAKTQFKSAPAIEVLRGASKAPLYVTAIGIDVVVAAEQVREMHGAHRIPTLLARVDALARAG